MTRNRMLVFTGGHHSSALEVAKRLSGLGWKVVWFGHRYSMWGDKADSAEYREVTAAGVGFYDLKAGKFYRTFHPLKLLRIPWGFVQAGWWLWRIRPTGIVSFGGYLAVPTVCCGWLLGIPAVTHEQTASAGWANRVIGRLVKKICLTFPDSGDFFPKEKIVVTGLPVPAEIKAIKRVRPAPDTVFISGGKQGSHAINQAVFSELPQLLERYKIIHQIGMSTVHSDFVFAQALKARLSSDKRLRYEISEYLFGGDFAVALGRSQAVVGRSGGHFTYYLGFLGKPAVLIPLPNSSHGEQLHSAKKLEQAGLAVVLPQAELTQGRLLMSIEKVLQLRPTALPFPADATERLVEAVESVMA